MHPVLLIALVGVVAFVAGLLSGGAMMCRSFREMDDFSIPLWAASRAQTVLGVLRTLRNGQSDQAIEYLEQRLDLELKQFVGRLEEHPRALREEQFRTLLGRIAEYRMAHASPEPCPDLPLELLMDNGETVRVWPSLSEALAFARQHGVIELGRL